ncbi:receptor like protein kinase S.2 [Magnolia sinica]|uniref:receptor like protein kinase S.2 n=1 Tax=Magnolia sinica TaxID=86752 RepID=UPI002659ECCB|nr:receptor like protein kinase S.2 [Magnolia sinica]
MQQLNRFCLILPANIFEPSDHDTKELPPPSSSSPPSTKRERIRRWFTDIIRSFCCCSGRKSKCMGSFHPQSIHAKAYYSGVLDSHQQFQDMAGIITSDQMFRGNPRIFSYAELYIGSNGFSEEELLGSGGFGRVYRAVLPSDGTVVAVKCVADKGERFEKTFAAELAAVAQLRHRNLVRLRGWCVHEDQLLLVYDYMPNRSLDRLLFRRQQDGSAISALLSWERRWHIVSGLAAGLFYLHEQLETQIIHRDVKTSNVMLDSDYNARLGDFGLARWLEHDHKHDPSPKQLPPLTMKNYRFRLAETTMIGGTIGYLPPESFQRRSATAKSDVFSFGIVLLEVVSGRRAVDLTYSDEQIVLLDWVRRLSDDGKMLQAGDSRLMDGSYKLLDMERLIHLGLLCSLNDPQSRPTMKWVMEALSQHYSGELPSLPSFHMLPPYISLSSPTTSATTTTTTTETTTDSLSAAFVTATGNTMFVTADDGSGDSGSRESNRHHLTSFPSVDTPREISFKEILAATNNFSEAQMVAEMDFGTAYHGYLNNRLHVLVKRLGMKTCPALRARFSNELQNLGNLRHRHLVQLRGWCTEQGEMLVIYDYLTHRSLSLLLFPHHHKIGRPLLRWRHRYNIIKSLASAILYLHEQWDEQVIHRNITSSAIFLDSDMNPRLGSFALAEFLTRNEHGHHVVTSSNTAARGIFGYMSPEYMESGKATTMADVYSFGVVVLEVVSGRKAVDFRWPEVLLVEKIRGLEARKRQLVELVDWRLDGEYDCRELLRLVRLGLACTHSNPESRPCMRQIVSILDGNESCLQPVTEERRDDWERKNISSLSLVKRIQALGIY